MPRGDRTGPAGMGPMTGRAAGYCAGYNMPGFMNPFPGSWGPAIRRVSVRTNLLRGAGEGSTSKSGEVFRRPDWGASETDRGTRIRNLEKVGKGNCNPGGRSPRILISEM